MTNEPLQTMADRFSAAAELYAVSEQKGGDDLAAIVDAVAIAVGDSAALVVDVATGPGSTALALAAALPAAHVVGTDLSDGMIDTARRRAGEMQVANAAFEVTDAEHLPFGDGEVDVLTCRIAAHHFPDIPAWLAESGRVLRAGGSLVLLDSEAPVGVEEAAFLHDIEVTRDPTHVRALTEAEWTDAIAAAGLTVERVGHYPKPKDFESWLVRGGAGVDAQDHVRELVRHASPPVVAALCIEYDDSGAPTRFADEKVFVVATKPAAR